jgi:hypothetical protein
MSPGSTTASLDTFREAIRKAEEDQHRWSKGLHPYTWTYQGLLPIAPDACRVTSTSGPVATWYNSLDNTSSSLSQSYNDKSTGHLTYSQIKDLKGKL